MRILRTIKGEEWIEKKRRREFWIGLRRKYPQKLYSRLTKSYLGWWLYFRVHAVWSRASLLIDPMSNGGFYSHVRCFLFNWIMVDIIWRIKHRIWIIFHKKEWDKQCAFMSACMQATNEGYADPMPVPDGFSAEWFHGAILGERYFQRVAEIITQSDEAVSSRE